MGVAVGCIGMRPDDFKRCYVDEFEAICAAWSRMREGDSRAKWERMRISASIGISPHIKNPIPPKKLLPLPWDSEGTPEEPKAPAHEPMSREERRERMRRAAERMGVET